MATIEQRNQEATIYVGNLEKRVTDELIWELFTQCGPVESVFLPTDKVTGLHNGYGFVEFKNEHDADYAIKLMNMVQVYGQPIKVSARSMEKRALDIGANLFIGNLDEMVDEKLLYDTFSTFGTIVETPKVQRDVGNAKGCGFVSFDSFEASDMAIQCMNGQYLCNRQINVEYAFKKNSKGERHGSHAERLLALELRTKQKQQQSPGSSNQNHHHKPPPPMMPPMMMMMGRPPPLPTHVVPGGKYNPASAAATAPPPPPPGPPMMMMMMRPPPLPKH